MRDEQPEPELPESSEAAAPPTEPAGSLVPPPRHPPTALGASAEQPSPARRFQERWRQPGWRARPPFAAAVEELLDVIDRFADDLASRLGLR
jgi:hypothetical protein